MKSQTDGVIRHLFGDKELERIDEWIAAQDDPAIDRARAVRRLVRLGLKAKR